MNAQRCAFPLAMSLLLLASCSRQDTDTLPGTLERDRIELVADADESIVAQPLAEGSAVKAGDVVVVQDGAISASQLDAARAQL
ncbi:MAG: hemolysin secretion protein D, partial [Steroidobacteraceae bacterium]|nr:hemolysin secretion protein D [Steroidobacteraceae bacterium]